MATSIKKTIKNTALFNKCDDRFLDTLTAQATLKSADKGQVFFVHEEEAERFYIIQKGWIKLYRETLDGTQAILDILPTGHIFGETSIFEDNIYPYSAEATEASEVISLPLALLKKEIENNPQFALTMLSTMAKYRKQQDKEIEHMTLQNAAQRIGCFLLRLTNQDKTPPITLHLPYDKTLVAARLGMQPETFSRALSKLKTTTGIETKGATVTVHDLKRLSDYVCMACSANFPCKDL